MIGARASGSFRGRNARVNTDRTRRTKAIGFRALLDPSAMDALRDGSQAPIWDRVTRSAGVPISGANRIAATTKPSWTIDGCAKYHSRRATSGVRSGTLISLLRPSSAFAAKHRWVGVVCLAPSAGLLRKTSHRVVSRRQQAQAAAITKEPGSARLWRWPAVAVLHAHLSPALTGIPRGAEAGVCV